MAHLNSKEALVLAELKNNARGGQAKEAVAEMFNLARKEAAKNAAVKAGIHYAALAEYSLQNQNLPMRAARSYHKAGQPQDAARWYLEAAERYAVMHQTTQAVATLRLYHEVAPGEHRGPKRIFNICREQGNSASGLYEFLSLKDKAIHKLRAEDVFAMLDEHTFEMALDAMIGRDLGKRETLTQTGDTAESVFVIVHGRVENILTLAGKRTHLGYLGKGDICSVIPYFTGGRRSSDMAAVEDTELLELPYKILDALRQQSPEFAQQLEALYAFQVLVKQLALAPLFNTLDASMRNEVARFMQVQSLQAGELLYQEGDHSCDVYLVRSGSVAMNLKVHGKERQFRTIKTGNVIGEISVAIQSRRVVTARAISDCQLVRLNGDVYQRLFDEHASLRETLEKRKDIALDKTRAFVRQLSMVDGDDTCALLLKDIWSE